MLIRQPDQCWFKILKNKIENRDGQEISFRTKVVLIMNLVSMVRHIQKVGHLKDFGNTHEDDFGLRIM